ncbi:transcription repressor OFP15-like [Hibiscus syriacus]|uniref:transcription repressor OFP15-like n=1 Tax=Hibiscus syriacus TaxID=106335 RepID=UPI001922722B|nr:transcription repressor OFP15-like [Hibiscus syriacus]
MGKKMNFSFLSNAKHSNIVHKSSWQWLPSCHQPRTLSFRADDSTSAYLDSIADDTVPLETVIRGLRSDRLFFEPGETSSIMEEATKRNKEEEDDDGVDGLLPFKDSTVVLSMESPDPYTDFRVSMEEMVEAEGFKDWEGLEQLLFWYLRANGKCNHGYIVAAFVDMLVARLAINVSNSKSDNICSPSSPLSFYTSPSSSSSEDCSSTTIPCVCPIKVDQTEMSIIKGTDDDDASSSLFVV